MCALNRVGLDPAVVKVVWRHDQAHGRPFLETGALAVPNRAPALSRDLRADLGITAVFVCERIPDDMARVPGAKDLALGQALPPNAVRRGAKEEFARVHGFVTACGFGIIGRVHDGAPGADEVVIRRAVNLPRYQAELWLLPMVTVGTDRIKRVTAVPRPSPAVIPHAVAFAVLGRQYGGCIDDVLLPGLVHHHDGIIGVFVEGMVAAHHVFLRRNQVIVQEHLPRPGEVSERLRSQGGGDSQEGQESHAPCEEQAAPADGGADAGQLLSARFPLTPALSPGERENDWPRTGKSRRQPGSLTPLSTWGSSVRSAMSIAIRRDETVRKLRSERHMRSARWFGTTCRS